MEIFNYFASLLGYGNESLYRRERMPNMANNKRATLSNNPIVRKQRQQDAMNFAPLAPRPIGGYVDPATRNVLPRRNPLVRVSHESRSGVTTQVKFGQSHDPRGDVKHRSISALPQSMITPRAVEAYRDKQTINALRSPRERVFYL